MFSEEGRRVRIAALDLARHLGSTVAIRTFVNDQNELSYELVVLSQSQNEIPAIWNDFTVKNSIT